MKLIFTLLLMVLPLEMVAQTDYLPLLEEGKKWHYTYRNWATKETYKYVEYLSSDTIIDGKTYTKNCQQDGQVLNLLREEGGKVYKYNNRQKNEKLLYDFTLSVGDIAESWSEDEGIIVTDIGEISTGGVSRKKMALCYYSGEYIDYDRPNFWVEGMGSDGGLTNPFSNQMAGNFVFLDYIEMPDGTTFEFKDINSVRSVENGSATNRQTFDLQGRKVSKKHLPKGVYIRDGKKYIQR